MTGIQASVRDEFIMRIIVVTGISGSGKSVALNVLEDSGYFCIDNLPSELLLAAAQNAHSHGVTRLAVAIDVRSLASEPTRLNQTFHTAMTALRAWQDDVRLLFLSASTPTLIARYSETRRSHPLAKFTPNHDASLEECIALERQYLAGVYDVSHVIDTSALANAALRHSVRQFAQATGVGLTLTFESFGFKYALPQDADLVFDARCLPNPHYEPALKSLTGLDEPVVQYFASLNSVQAFVDDVAQFLTTWLPRYEQDGRNYLTVAIGCTGGQHRSVYVAEALAKQFANKARVITRHRQQAARL